MPGVNWRLILAVAGVALLGVAYWSLGTGPERPAGEVGTALNQTPPATGSIEPPLGPVIEAAKAASARAMTDASGADAVAAVADGVAARAAGFAADAKAAATAARTAAAKACKAPGGEQGCTAAGDGTRYEGGQSCRADGCGPDGYGVFTDAQRGWESQGRWENWSLVLGCDSMKGVITYCGQQIASAWSGYGISYNSNAAAISAEWLKGAARNPIQLDYPAGSRMRGEMVNYELDGLGVYERSDKQIRRGRWQAGKLVSGLVTYPVSGVVVSGAFVDGRAKSGIITYRDGRMFVGEIEDGPDPAPARPQTGVLYAPDGSIENQGSGAAIWPLPLE